MVDAGLAQMENELSLNGSHIKVKNIISKQMVIWQQARLSLMEKPINLTNMETFLVKDKNKWALNERPYFFCLKS